MPHVNFEIFHFTGDDSNENNNDATDRRRQRPRPESSPLGELQLHKLCVLNAAPEPRRGNTAAGHPHIQTRGRPRGRTHSHQVYTGQLPATPAQ